MNSSVDFNCSVRSHTNVNQIPVHITLQRKNPATVVIRPKPVRKIVRRNNKILKAIKLPKVMNLNPRSIYNKAEEFCLLLDMYETDICFMSETWDRADKPLEDIIKKENYKIIKNPVQRTFKGGKPALFVNEDNFYVKPLSPEPITVPIGVEAVWA